MRVKKLFKITGIVVASLALLVLFLVAFLLFNPFEGSLPEMRDIVPRNVDFFVHKADLRADFRGSGETFPIVPGLAAIGQRPAWQALKDAPVYRESGFPQMLDRIRAEVAGLRKDVPQLDILRDVIGQRIQLAGRLGEQGFDDARWCLYARIGWRAKAAHGLLRHGMVREEVAKNQVVVNDDEDFYKITVPGMVGNLWCVRYLDCLMLSNDRQLIRDSLELALQGSVAEIEPLGTSSHYQDGVREPLQTWQKVTTVQQPNVLEMHLRAYDLFPKLPALRNWPNAADDEAINQKILASFINLESWRFLSGSLIFENESLTLLTHLVVNNNKLTEFQKELFKPEVTPRDEWMNQFFQMVPLEACGAAAMRMQAGDFVREMVKNCLDSNYRRELDGAIRATGKYKGTEDLISRLESSLRPRVGIVMRPNRRSAKSVQDFPVHNPSPFPQGAFVFWVRKSRSGALQNSALKDLVNVINQHRGPFNIQTAYKLSLQQAGSADVAFEFAIPQMPGTGSIALCTYGEYFIVSSSGPFISRMMQAYTGSGGVESMRETKDFRAFEAEMPPSINGVAFVWSENLLKVADDFETFAAERSSEVDPAWAMQNMKRAEELVFARSYNQYGTPARIPPAQKKAFQDEAYEEVKRLWSREGRNVVADPGVLQNLRGIAGVFRSAYLQMTMKPESMQIWARLLSPEFIH